MQSLLLVALTLGNSAAGFALQVLIARRYGVGVESDAYFRALAVPLFCSGLFSAQSVFRAVPALMLRAAQGPGPWRAAAGSYWRTALAIGAGVAAIGVLLGTPGLPWARAAAGGAPALEPLCWAYGAAQFPLLAAIALLQSRHRYVAAAIATGLPQVVACVALLIVPRVSIAVVPAALTAASVLLAALLGAGLLSGDPVSTSERRDGFGRRVVLESPFTAATLACFSVYAVIDSALLPRYGSGFLTSASVCQRLVVGLGQLVIAAPLTLITRDLVARVDDRDPEGFERCLRTTLARVVLHASAVAAGLYVTADWVMRAVLSSRAGASLDPGVAARTLRQMLPGMVVMCASTILVRSALTIPGLVRRTWWLGAVWGGLYALGVALLSGPGLNQSGLAYSLSWLLAALGLILFLRRVGPAFILAEKR
jgi:putative peptidoglycan lipid II flippase